MKSLRKQRAAIGEFVEYQRHLQEQARKAVGIIMAVDLILGMVAEIIREGEKK